MRNPERVILVECKPGVPSFAMSLILKPRLIMINHTIFRTVQAIPNKTHSSQKEDSKGINSCVSQVRSHGDA